MNVLVINGSPKGGRSNTMQLTRAFVRGLGVTEQHVRQLDLCTMNVAPCKGCFSCWNKTPGKCVIADDMAGVIQDELWADVIIWSFPLYYFGVPGPLKNMIDRQLPMALPFMTERSDGVGSGSHPARYDMSGTRHVLISTCGFWSAEKNYDGVVATFDHTLGKGSYETLFCAQGELFRVPELCARCDEYLNLVERAGREYVAAGICAETRRQLSQLLYPKEVFEEMADASWGIEREGGEAADESLTFTRQMAALYRKEAWDRDRVLEMHYTDLDTTYQILLGKDGSRVVTDGSLTATTRIDTPFSVWQQIARGEISGTEALGRRLYSVSGDFSLMIHWDDFFRSTSGASEAQAAPGPAATGKGRPSMLTMLIPWIAFWVAVSITPVTGAAITLAVCACVPLVMGRHEFVLWDKLSLAAVGLLSLVAFFMGDGNLATNVGYLAFGLMWLVSCLVREPLCATYVKYDYGAEKALSNPLFMETNYILAAAWGVLYLLTATWTFFLRRAGIGNWLIVVNNLVPAVMGVFTSWFQKWYPAWRAAGH